MGSVTVSAPMSVIIAQQLVGGPVAPTSPGQLAGFEHLHVATQVLQRLGSLLHAAAYDNKVAPSEVVVDVVVGPDPFVTALVAAAIQGLKQEGYRGLRLCHHAGRGYREIDPDAVARACVKFAGGILNAPAEGPVLRFPVESTPA